MPRPGDQHAVRTLYVEEHKRNRKKLGMLGRTTVRLPAQTEVSFGTYFNAFAASYWRRWTTLDEVQLRLRIDGECRVDVYRSKADGTRVYVRGETLVGDRRDLVVNLDLGPFEDGGWYWFDITTEKGDDVLLLEGGWYAPREAPGRVDVALGMPTFNRPNDCVGVLKAIADDDLLLSVVSTVIVPDQGTNNVSDHPDFEDARKNLGNRLKLIRQPNFGGSGGYARIMYEALRTEAQQIVYMDDDIAIEPDCILRAVAFSRFAERPMLVGAHMLDLYQPSHLHAMGEVVDPHSFMWRAAPGARYNHDFAKSSLRKSPWLHRRIDVDYNGWWTCLIPRVVAEDIGLPIPLFLKWDDTEYALRAGRAGYPTASVPGIAAWHMPWTDKNDATDWQAYFHLRNRLVAAALHGSSDCPMGLFKNSMTNVLKHLLSLEYSTVALHDRAIRDFAAGPDNLFDLLPTAIRSAREIRGGYDDARIVPTARRLPPPTMDLVTAERFLRPPERAVDKGTSVLASLVHNVVPANPEHHERPQLNVPARSASWFLLSRLDGATVAMSDGRGVTYRKRDPKVFWGLLGQMVKNHIFLAKEFRHIRKRYVRAHRSLASVSEWDKIFSRYPAE